MKRIVKVSAFCIVMTLIVALFCAPVQALGTTPTRYIVGGGTVGEGVGKQTTLIDFASSELGGFTPFAGTEVLNFGGSAVWGTNVLKTHLSAPNGEMGITKIFSDVSLLANASTLSVQTVAQTNAYTVTLRLSGVDKNGSALTWEAHVPVTTNHWQTVTFDISSFAALVNTNAPVSVTLLASSDTEEDTGADWMIKSIYVSAPQTFPEYVLPIAAAACGLVLGFTLFFMIYRATCKKNRRPRWEEER